MKPRQMTWLMALFPVSLAYAAPATPPAPPPEAPMPVVQVDGLADPDEQPYRRMLKGMDAFERYHALAPDAQLRFRLYPRRPGVKVAGTRLAIQGDKLLLPLVLDGDLAFTLPRNAQALQDDAQVTTNRHARSFAWAPDVRTPGLPPSTRRLGDLRLECEIDRAATLLVGYKPPLYHVLDAAVDVCTVFPGAWLYYGERALFNVTLVHGQRRQSLLSNWLYGNSVPKIFHLFYDFYPLLGERTYSLKISDSSWPDDTLVELEYVDDEVPSTSPAQAGAAS